MLHIPFKLDDRVLADLLLDQVAVGGQAHRAAQSHVAQGTRWIFKKQVERIETNGAQTKQYQKNISKNH